KEEIDDSLLRRAYEKNYYFYNRPEVRRFEHVLVGATDKDPPERRERARALAEEILAAARRTSPPLNALRPELAPRRTALGLPLRYETGPGVRQGLEDPFANLLFATPAGALGSEVVRTGYGWHVLRCLKIEPAVTKPFDLVREDVRDRLWPEYR